MKCTGAKKHALDKALSVTLTPIICFIRSTFFSVLCKNKLLGRNLLNIS